MPATADPSLRNAPWTQPEQITGGYSFTEQSGAPFLDERSAHADAYWGYPELQASIREAHIINEAAERIAPYVQSSNSNAPLILHKAYSEQLGCAVYFKEEQRLSVGSFKMRGAINKALSLDVHSREQGFLAVSAGNHAQGVARAAQIVNAEATIFMPETTPRIKVDAVKALGGVVRLVGASFEEAKQACDEYRQANPHMPYFHPFDDIDIIAGQGTIGQEIFTELPQATHVFCPVGGGGALAGIALSAQENGSSAQLIGVEPTRSASFAAALEQGNRTTLSVVRTHAEGAAVAQVGSTPYSIFKNNPNVKSQVVSEEDLIDTTLELNSVYGQVECTGALGVTALRNCVFAPSDVVVAVITGKHIDQAKLAKLKALSGQRSLTQAAV